MLRNVVDSGYFWLGKQPAEWTVVRGKDLFRKVSLPVREEDEVVTCFRDGVTTLRKNRREDGFTFALKEIGYQGVRTGHLVVHAMDAFAGAIGIADSDGKCSPVYSVCSPKHHSKIHLPYYAWVLRNMATAGYIQSVAKGIRERSTDFRYSEVEEAHFTLPSRDEQRRIAAWLDLQTSRIDKRIELLDAKRGFLVDLRKAIITEAVCRGVDETAELKFSGVDAIGKIPKHWKVVRLKELTAKIGSGKTPSGGSSVYSETGITFIRSQNVWDEGIALDDVVFISNEIDREMRATRVKPKDILLNITGGSIGRSALVPATFPKANVNQHVCIIRLRNNRLAEYVALAMLAQPTKAQIGIEQVGAARDGLNFEQVGRLAIPLPPLESERHQIVDSITTKVRKIDRQIQLLDRLKVLLVEQRKALIHEAVTGKIDLSNYEPPAQAA